MKTLIPRFFDKLLTLSGVILLLIPLFVLIGVVMSKLGVTSLVTFDASYPFIGQQITFNTIYDLQWYLFAAAAMFSSAAVLMCDKHVRVDFFYQGFSQRTRHLVNIVGTLAFTLPFFGYLLPAAWRFAYRSYHINEKSAGDGLNAVWVVKMLLPLGIGLMLLAAVILLIQSLFKLFARSQSNG